MNDGRLWGNDAEANEVGLLAERDATQALLDMAPRAGSRDDAARLAHDLGLLPLALHVAGTHLGSPFALWRSFESYRQARHDLGLLSLLEGSRRIGDEAKDRRNLQLTWEMSLTALADHGLPQCRPLLGLLSCFATSTPIPEDLLHAPAIRTPLGCASDTAMLDVRRRLLEGLTGLSDQSLISRHSGSGGSATQSMIVLHPVVAETNRPAPDDRRPAGSPQAAPGLVARTAVELVTAFVKPLRFDDDTDWPRFGLVAPHLSALLGSVASRLDDDALAQLVWSAAHVAASHAWSGSEAAAEQLADDALRHANRLGENHPATLQLRNERAWAIGRDGRWRQAHTELVLVRDARLARLGPEHPDTLDSRHKLAWAVGKLGDWPAAEAQLRAVLAARTQVLDQEHPDTLHSRCCLAWAMGQCGRPEEAEQAYREVIAARERVLGKDHVETLDAHHSLAELYVRHERFQDAEQVLRKLVRVWPRPFGSRFPETLVIRPRYWLGRSLHGLGRHREADRVLRQLLDDQVQFLGPQHPAVEDTREQLGSRARRQPRRGAGRLQAG